MKSKETSSAEEANRLLERGWRIYRIKEENRKIIFWLMKDEEIIDKTGNTKRRMK